MALEVEVNLDMIFIMALYAELNFDMSFTMFFEVLVMIHTGRAGGCEAKWR